VEFNGIKSEEKIFWSFSFLQRKFFFSSLKLKNDFLTRSEQKFRNEGKKEIKLEEEIL
jgi:hypothetical protein